MARKLGVRSPLDVGGHFVPAMGLGSIAVSPLDMASAYATLAAGGVYSEPTAIRKVVLPNGKEDTKAGWGTPKRTRVIPDGVACEGDADPRGQRQLRHRARGPASAGPRPARRARPTSTPTPGSSATRPTSRPRSGWATRRGEIPMESVHGIAVSGGSFPAEIWRLHDGADDRAAPGAGLPRADARSRSTSRSSAARCALSYDPYYVAPDDDARPRRPRPTTTPTTATPRTSTPAPDRRPRGRDDPRREPRRPRSPPGLRSCSPSSPRRARSPGAPTRRSSRATAGTSPGPRRSSSSLLVARLRRLPRWRSPASAGRRRSTRGRRRSSPPRSSSSRSAAPLLLSTDAWTYWSYGWIGARGGGNPYVDTPEEFPDNPALPYMGSGLAGHDDASTGRPSRSPPSRSRSSPATSDDVGGLDVQDARRAAARSRPRCSPAGSPGAGRSPSPSSAGTRSSRCTSPEAATTTPGSARSSLAALALSASRRLQAAGALWALAVARQVGAARSSSRCARDRGARDRARPSAHRGLRGRGRAVVVRSRPGSTAARWPVAVRAARRQRRARDELRAPAPARAARACRTALALALAVAVLARRPRLARARGRPRPRPARPRGLPRARDDAVPRGLVPGLGGAARRGRGGRRPRTVGCLALCAYLLPQTIPALSGARARSTRTPSSSPHDPPARVAPEARVRARRTCRPRRRRRGSSAAVRSTATQRASRSTGKLKMRRRSERCAPSVLVALTAAPGGHERAARAPRPGRGR